MLIIGVDTETTGLSPETDRITELGAVAWDAVHATPVAFFHRFIKQEKSLLPEIVELTGLTDELLAKHGQEEKQVLQDFHNFCGTADVMVAHNAPFDKSMIEASYLRCGLLMNEFTWVDTTKDVPYPAKIKNKNLIGLAAEHKFLNPFPHRAVTDVLTMLTILSNYDLETVIANAREPKILIWAQTTFAEKDKAKAAGFYWAPDRKMWYKNIFMRDLMKETERCAQLGFDIKVINEKVEEKTGGKK